MLRAKWRSRGKCRRMTTSVKEWMHMHSWKSDALILINRLVSEWIRSVWLTKRQTLLDSSIFILVPYSPLHLLSSAYSPTKLTLILNRQYCFCPFIFVYLSDLLVRSRRFITARHKSYPVTHRVGTNILMFTHKNRKSNVQSNCSKRFGSTRRFEDDREDLDAH